MPDLSPSARSLPDTHWTAAELSRILNAPVGTIYRWASEDNWPRKGSRKHPPVRYPLSAADASATRRRAVD